MIVKINQDKINNLINSQKISNKIISSVQEKVSRELDVFQREAIDYMKDYIEEQWYSKYEPKDYIRTGGLLNSVICKIEEKRTKYVVKIGYDARKMTSTTNEGNWNTHRSFGKRVGGIETTKGVDFKKGLIDFVENGFSSPRGLSPRNSSSGIKMLDETRYFFEDYLQTNIGDIYSKASQTFIQNL